MKQGENSRIASKLLAESKKDYKRIFAQEVEKEKKKRKPYMPDASKRASARYNKESKLSWSEALTMASKGQKKKSKPRKEVITKRYISKTSKPMFFGGVIDPEETYSKMDFSTPKRTVRRKKTTTKKVGRKKSTIKRGSTRTFDDFGLFD